MRGISAVRARLGYTKHKKPFNRLIECPDLSLEVTCDVDLNRQENPCLRGTQPATVCEAMPALLTELHVGLHCPGLDQVVQVMQVPKSHLSDSSHNSELSLLTLSAISGYLHGL